jgi:hypothetical protein
VKYWEIIANNNLSKAGWSWGCVSAIDSNGERFQRLQRVYRSSQRVQLWSEIRFR